MRIKTAKQRIAALKTHFLTLPSGHDKLFAKETVKRRRGTGNESNPKDLYAHLAALHGYPGGSHDRVAFGCRGTDGCFGSPSLFSGEVQGRGAGEPALPE